MKAHCLTSILDYDLVQMVVDRPKENDKVAIERYGLINRQCHTDRKIKPQNKRNIKQERKVSSKREELVYCVSRSIGRVWRRLKWIKLQECKYGSTKIKATSLNLKETPNINRKIYGLQIT